MATLLPPNRDELLELRPAAERARQQSLRLEAERLTSLTLKLEAAQTRAAWRPVAFAPITDCRKEPAMPPSLKIAVGSLAVSVVVLGVKYVS
ncbi:hypothetical protein ACFPYM_01120 [Methylobacterium hispanicum]|uniref:hypothetical protein n=1 Tax=Methylobacterium hispanicum TaxID=270350 RepID=UPI001EDF71E9|nr:hypothetical protein [Methylobacterium hispanicum]